MPLQLPEAAAPALEAEAARGGEEVGTESETLVSVCSVGKLILRGGTCADSATLFVTVVEVDTMQAEVVESGGKLCSSRREIGAVEKIEAFLGHSERAAIVTESRETGFEWGDGCC